MLPFTYLPTILANYAASLHSRFERKGNMSDLDEAISTMESAVGKLPAGHIRLPALLSNLGRFRQTRYQRTGDLSSIDEAIATLRKAVELVSADDGSFPIMLTNLGMALQSRFRHTGDVSNIKEAILFQKSAVDLTPAGHSSLPTRLNNLGFSFRSLFEQSGDLTDIAEAITAHRQAVEASPESHASLPTWLNNLGYALQSRYERTDELEDLDEAISVERRAVELTPEDHPSLPMWLASLGCSLHSLSERSDGRVDMSEAILMHVKAVNLTLKEDAQRPIWLNNLGLALELHFRNTCNPSDISAAIERQREAVDLLPTGHAFLPSVLICLGKSLHTSFEHSGELSSLNEAISVKQKAVYLMPEGHSALPTMLESLGISIYSRSVTTGSSEDLESSISHFSLAATSSTGPPMDRLSAATHWTRALTQRSPPTQEWLPAYDVAVCLIALVVGLDQTVQRRYAELPSIAGVALEAASVACELGRPDRAVEWLEQGRCVLWNQLNNLRSPLDDLRIHDSALAERLKEISGLLESAGYTRRRGHSDMSMSEKISMEDEARAHVYLAKEWDDLLKTVRSIPEFHSFLQPASFASLKQNIPPSGTIVVLNVHERRCDAIVLSAGLDEPLHITIPEFSLAKANGLLRSLNREGLRASSEGENLEEEPSEGFRPLGTYRRHRHGVLHHILQSLWRDLITPILNSLGIQKRDESSKEPLPRIWWCPTGPLAFLPIHAAGVYKSGESETILEYAVSSYTPTITALTARFKNTLSIERGVSGLFLTSQPRAPGSRIIDGTTTEVESVYARARENGVRVIKVEGDLLDVDGCLRYMEAYSSVHLACHAVQTRADPLRSLFRLHKGTLELRRIIQSDLKNADLAFLSACQTSTGDETLSDEAVHLAAGMLAAGYRRVVATMWSISDRYAPGVADDFYRYLWSERKDGSGSGFDGTRSAYALHDAIQKLRLRLEMSEETIGENLLAWAPYVHFGY
ncbi:hypothetical protein NMY22_g1966 [Coprinellus aureogranulatus]|nr:hypothetical protein NMY22_g1966 [Coprinellus aureogranulatus]